MIPELHTYYLSKQEPVKSSLLALRTIVLNHDTNITETLKYGMPCFCYKNKMFCYLWTDKKTGEPYILMVEETPRPSPTRSRQPLPHENIQGRSW